MANLTKQQRKELAMRNRVEINRELKRRAAITLAQMPGPDQFWYFCKAINPSFYKDDRLYLKELCHALQYFALEDERQYFLLSLPPQHGKSYTVSLLDSFLFGVKHNFRIINVSYAQTVTEKLSNTVRSVVQNAVCTNDELSIVFSDIFPHTRFGKGPINEWYMDKSPVTSFKATSIGGQLTSFGGDIGIIDDPIKDHYIANNAVEKHKIYEWYKNTFRSRVNNGKTIIIMTRWADDDLIGRIKTDFDLIGIRYSEFLRKAYDEETDTMLCEELYSKEQYNNNFLLAGEDLSIFLANYQQQPISARGKLYGSFETYDPHTLFTQTTRSFAYIDTADKGKDYLCMVIWKEHKGKHYVQDVLYTNESMEVTEIKVADMLNEYARQNGRIDVYCESNNGGRGFGRTIDKGTSSHVNILHFTQRKNKEARILTYSSKVNKDIIFPYDWQKKYPSFYQEIETYQRAGKNMHDDAVDTLTGIVEKMELLDNNEYNNYNNNSVSLGSVISMFGRGG